jgi:hypothetical protein
MLHEGKHHTFWGQQEAQNLHHHLSAFQGSHVNIAGTMTSSHTAGAPEATALPLPGESDTVLLHS